MIVVITVIIVVILITIGIYLYLEYFTEEEPIEEDVIIKEIDDRISPLTPPAVSFEIQRIRKHGIEEVMRKRGTSWKKQPSFSYNLTINDIGFLKVKPGTELMGSKGMRLRKRFVG